MVKGELHEVLRDNPTTKPYEYTKTKYGKNGRVYSVVVRKDCVTPHTEDVDIKDTNKLKYMCHVQNVYYAAGTRTLKIIGTVRSFNKPGKQYSVEVAILDVKKEEGLTDEQVLSGFFPRPNINEKTIQVKCNCECYHFRFAEANKKRGDATGYVGKLGTSKSGRAPNNPENIPGECKHLRTFVSYLIIQGFVVNE